MAQSRPQTSLVSDKVMGLSIIFTNSGDSA